MFDVKAVVDAIEKQNAALRAKLADRERRIRLARRMMPGRLTGDAYWRDQMYIVLDLRRPLSGKKGRR